MSQTRAATFGRRGAPQGGRRLAVASLAPPPVSTGPGGETDRDFETIAKKIAAEVAADDPDSRVALQGDVPWSMRAVFLAGFIAAVFQAAVHVVGMHGPTEIIPGLQINIGEGSMLTPILLVSGIISGARIAAFTIFPAHFLLKRLQQKSLAAYAIGGALAAAGEALLMSSLRGAPREILLEAATGLATGFFYRMFAGLRR